jgi:cation transport ATPase
LEVLPIMEDREKQRRDTERTASTNMLRFVVTILIIALLLAAAWFFLFTPGDPSATVS